MSSLFITFKIAAANLIQHGRRTLFLATAIAAVTALLLLLGGLSAGVRDSLVTTATTLSTGHVNVGGFFKVTSGQSGAVVTGVKALKPIVAQAVPEAAFMVERGRGWAKVVSDTGSAQAGINGVDIVNEPEFKNVLTLTAGKLEDLARPNTIMLFVGQAEKLGVRVGDAITISAQTTRGVANTIDCEVVAIAKDVGLLSKFNTFIPAETLRRLYQLREDATGAIHIHLRPQFIDQSKQIAARLRSVLEKANYAVMEPNSQAFWMKFQSVNREAWTGQKLDVTTWEDELSFMIWTLALLEGLRFVLLIILLAIVITGIMNTMWIAIRERTREIGALRAIGMQRGGVLRMFIAEALLLGLFGTIVGSLVGALIAFALNAAHIDVPISVQLFLMSDHLRLLVAGPALVSGIVMITAITVAASFYPALRAARLRPIEAMSHFG
ncbi:MAG: FtsX-like permease family protein [Deltaproteobacteria bacterium]|nr:FtsX-like permease family protein [Deltaproteobacteria bacterium]